MRNIETAPLVKLIPLSSDIERLIETLKSEYRYLKECYTNGFVTRVTLQDGTKSIANKITNLNSAVVRITKRVRELVTLTMDCSDSRLTDIDESTIALSYNPAVVVI